MNLLWIAEVSNRTTYKGISRLGVVHTVSKNRGAAQENKNRQHQHEAVHHGQPKPELNMKEKNQCGHREGNPMQADLAFLAYYVGYRSQHLRHAQADYEGKCDGENFKSGHDCCSPCGRCNIRRPCLFELRRCSFLQHLNQFLVTVGILVVGVKLGVLRVTNQSIAGNLLA